MASSSGQQVISREGFCHCYILQFQSMDDIHKDQDVGRLIQPSTHKLPKHHEDPSWTAREVAWAVRTVNYSLINVLLIFQVIASSKRKVSSFGRCNILPESIRPLFFLHCILFVLHPKIYCALPSP